MITPPSYYLLNCIIDYTPYLYLCKVINYAIIFIIKGDLCLNLIKEIYMKIFTQNLYSKEEYHYDTKTDFIPTITAYINGSINKKPSVLIVPGGSYLFVSSTEGEVIAQKFLNEGYNAFILTYSTRMSKAFAPLKEQALRDIAKAMVIIKENALTFHVDTENIVVLGASAGGHLVSCFCNHYNKDFLKDIRKDHDIRPSAQILLYPVISFEKGLIHEFSKFCLLGDDATEDEIKFMCNEQNVHEDTPKAFIFHCIGDETVDYKNSTTFARALGEKNIEFSLHIFPKGAHGISTCDEAWVKTSFDMDCPTNQLSKKLVERELICRDDIFTLFDIDIKEINSYEEYCNEAIKRRKFKDITLNEYKYASNWVKLALEWLTL